MAPALASLQRMSDLMASTSSLSLSPGPLVCTATGHDGASRSLRLVFVDVKQAVEFGHHVGHSLGVVVEHGDVAAGHVGHVHLVPVFDQPDERAAHADHVVVRVRAEADDLLRLAAGRMILDGVHHPAKHVMRDALGRTVMAQQLVQVVLAKVVVVELEQGLAALFAQPEQMARLMSVVGPLDLAQQPGRGDGRELAGGGRSSSITVALACSRR